MSELIKLNTNSNDITLSARELHNFLEVTERFNNWFNRQLQYGFEENRDYVGCKVFNTLAKQELLDYEIKLDMAKEIAMIQRSEKGKQARQYFLQVEKAWNSPEMIMKRALEIANKQVENLKLENMEQKKLLKEQKPKVLFADAVSTSQTSILVGELAKLIKQNGIDIGERRLFKWLRDNGYLIKRKGSDYNMPTQKSLELKVIETKERTINNPDGSIRITKTPKVTGKGQQYFINKFLN
ncbi:phage antirepressor KilAC domain-containing protein [Clostridium baratii]|uniref:phage antirepressor KilAC domain-containing protein n=1 Tax=Clostridium baratii TaxID=1561 RepID=UPI00374FB9E7